MAEPRVIDCAGTPAEMGRAQGLALAPAIRAARGALAGLEAFQLTRPAWLPGFLHLALAERRAAAALGPALAAAAPDHAARLTAMAEASGVGLGTLLLLNGAEPLMSSVARRTAAPGDRAAVPLGACTAAGFQDLGGEPAVARNFDYLGALAPFFLLRRSRPAGGLAALEFIAAPLSGAVDGINEAGLAVTYDYAYVVEDCAPAPTVSMLIQQALARFARAAEAAEWLASRPRWGAGLLMLADAGGDALSLELSPSRHALRRPAPGRSFLTHANHYGDPRLCAVQVDRAAVFGARAPRALRGRRVLASSEARAARMEELAGALSGPAGLDALLADHGPAGAERSGTLCVHSDYWNTVASVQLFPRRRALRVNLGWGCRADWRDFSVP